MIFIDSERNLLYTNVIDNNDFRYYIISQHYCIIFVVDRLIVMRTDFTRVRIETHILMFFNIFIYHDVLLFSFSIIPHCFYLQRHD